MNRFHRLFEGLPENIECVLITSDVNRRYFTGMKSSAGTVAAFRDKAYLIIDFRYIEKARRIVKTAEVIEENKLFSQISQLVKKHGARNMAVESMTMTVSRLSAFQKAFPDIEIIRNEKSRAYKSAQSYRIQYGTYGEMV